MNVYIKVSRLLLVGGLFISLPNLHSAKDSAGASASAVSEDGLIDEIVRSGKVDCYCKRSLNTHRDLAMGILKPIKLGDYDGLHAILCTCNSYDSERLKSEVLCYCVRSGDEDNRLPIYLHDLPAIVCSYASSIGACKVLTMLAHIFQYKLPVGLGLEPYNLFGNPIINLRKKSLDIIELLLLNGVFIDQITAEEHMRNLPEGSVNKFYSGALQRLCLTAQIKEEDEDSSCCGAGVESGGASASAGSQSVRRRSARRKPSKRQRTGRA